MKNDSAQRKPPHPYLSGNFAPIDRVQPLVACPFSGKIPAALAGGEYVRNGGNPVANEALGRDAHWFDGDGMLTGVFFSQSSNTGEVQPEFVNQYILTDVYLSTITSPALSSPLLPSIATLVNPLSSLYTITLRILRTLLLVLLSHLPGSKQAIKKISVANTAVLYHDGRALATCESGPPMRIALPSLSTVGWFNGDTCEGEPHAVGGPGFGGEGPLSFFREWTTAHPRVDPSTKELLLFHSTFVPPYVRYSILTPARPKPLPRGSLSRRFRHAGVPGVHSAKMMHDFGVSRSHTVILDLPLALDPLNLAKNRPVVAYDPTSRSRFGVFPRYRPEMIRWYETRACCIFHTANTWDSGTINSMSGEVLVESVNMLACRLTSASLVFSAGALAAPVPTRMVPEHEREEEQCRLYYYNFCLGPGDENVIRHQWALSAIPFEFPSLRDSSTMSPAKYVYGCSVSDSSFGAALGRAVKMNALVKMDVESLIARGRHDPPRSISGCVDTRNVDEILRSKEVDDPIKIFKMPEGWYAQESRFVPRQDGVSEDDGWLLSYVFDESQLQPDGECNPKAKSELWIIDAKSMNEVTAKVQLPQRVPYGLHDAAGHFLDSDAHDPKQPEPTADKAHKPHDRKRSVMEENHGQSENDNGEDYPSNEKRQDDKLDLERSVPEVATGHKRSTPGTTFKKLEERAQGLQSCDANEPCAPGLEYTWKDDKCQCVPLGKGLTCDPNHQCDPGASYVPVGNKCKCIKVSFSERSAPPHNP
ncbi:MAG: hypothetical protein Q9182_001078 [Xanthomendoza sp. 2 TL-2023]